MASAKRTIDEAVAAIIGKFDGDPRKASEVAGISASRLQDYMAGLRPEYIHKSTEEGLRKLRDYVEQDPEGIAESLSSIAHSLKRIADLYYESLVLRLDGNDE